MKTCSNCGHESYRVESNFCLKCGAKLPENGSSEHDDKNICTNPECDWHKTKFIYPDGASFCDVCGSRTAHSH